MQKQLEGKCEGTCGHSKGLQLAERHYSVLEKVPHSEPIRSRFKFQGHFSWLSSFALMRLGLPLVVPWALDHCLSRESYPSPLSAKLTVDKQLCWGYPREMEDVFLPHRSLPLLSQATDLPFSLSCFWLHPLSNLQRHPDNSSSETRRSRGEDTMFLQQSPKLCAPPPRVSDPEWGTRHWDVQGCCLES